MIRNIRMNDWTGKREQAKDLHAERTENGWSIYNGDEQIARAENLLDTLIHLHYHAQTTIRPDVINYLKEREQDEWVYDLTLHISDQLGREDLITTSETHFISIGRKEVRD